MADFIKGGGEWNVSVARGDDISITWNVVDSDGNAYDWTGASVAAAVVGAASNWSYDIGTTGVLTVSLTDVQTQAFGERTFEQYLRVTKGGITSTWLAGDLRIRPATEPVTSTQARTIKIVDAVGGTIRLVGVLTSGGGGGGGGGAPSGPAGGVLAGSYPNPTFAQDMATQAELNAAVFAGGGGAPSGAAGGVLSGTYPNPGFAVDMATQAELNAHTHAAADIVSGVIASARLGTGTADATTRLGGDGQWHADGVQNAALASAKQTAQLATTSTALADIVGLAFAVTAGHRYYVRFLLTAQSAATTTGAGVGFSGPAMTAWKAMTTYEQGADGTGFHAGASSNTPATIMLSFNVDASNDPFAVVVEAWFTPSASGTLQLRGSTEVAASTVTFLNQGVALLNDADGTISGGSGDGSYALPIELSTENAALTTGTKWTGRLPFGMDLSLPIATSASGSTSGAWTVDIQRSNVSILSTKLTVDAGEGTSTTAATPAVLSATSIAASDEITVIVLGAGASVLGAKLYIVGTRNDSNSPTAPPTSTARISEEFDASFEDQAASTDTTTATSVTGANTLAHNSNGPPDGSGLSLYANGTEANTLRWDLATVTVDKGKLYYKHGGNTSETYWFLEEYAANGTTIAWRLGCTQAGAFILQNGNAGTTDTANFTNVIGKNYRLDITVTGSTSVSIPVFAEAIINNESGTTPTDTLLVTLSATSVSDVELGLLVGLTGGSTTPANMTDEPFNGTNAVQVTNANTSADRHFGSGTLKFNTGWFVEGTSSMRVNGTAYDALEWDNPSHTHYRASYYMRFVTAPGTDKSILLQVKTGDNSAIAFEHGVDIAAKMFLRNSNNGTGTTLATAATAMTTTTVYRHEVDVTAGATGATVRTWRGATLDSPLTADAWQTATMAGAISATNFSQEHIGQNQAVTTAADYSIDRWKSANNGMPSPLGGGTGAPCNFWIEHMWWDSATMPPNVQIEIETDPGGGGGGGGGSGSTVSQKLVPPDGRCWWGAATGTDALVQTGSTTAGQATWVGFAGRRPDIHHFYKTGAFTGPTSAERTQMLEPPGQARAIGLYNWKVGSGTQRDIANGSGDAQLLAFCNGIKQYPYHIFLTLWHEYDNNENENTTGNSFADYVAMWRHCVTYIRAQGVKNVVFVWTQTGYSGQAGAGGADYDAMYPGDDVIDWICQQPYWDTTSAARDNFAELVNETFSASGGWTGFYNWAATKHPTKPQMLGEWGPDFSDCLSDTQAAARINTIASQIANFPKIKALVQWNSLVVSNGAHPPDRIDSRIQHHPLSEAAFASVGALPYFNIGTNNIPVPA